MQVMDTVNDIPYTEEWPMTLMSLPIRSIESFLFGSGNYHLSLNNLKNDDCLLLCGLLYVLTNTSNRGLWMTNSRKHDSDIYVLEVIISI